MPIDRRFRAARVWSNEELRSVASCIRGEVANVSGADDLDKQGGRYQSYFSEASSYTLTNYSTDFRGFRARPGEVFLDLTAPLPTELHKRFDTAFNHTTLEHVFDVDAAFTNLCDIAREYVIVVVPFAQVEHGPPSFGDYWRFTPMALEAMFQRVGWQLAYLSASPMKRSAIYLFAVGAADSELASRLPAPPSLPTPLGAWIGASASASARALAARAVRRALRRPSEETAELGT